MAISDDQRKAQQQLFQSVKDKIKGLDSKGNLIIDDEGAPVSFAAADFEGLVDEYKKTNPTAKAGDYESAFNKSQFEDIEKQGNKFQGFDQSGNLIYRNEKNELENFGKSGGFAEFAKSQMGDKQFNLASQGQANRQTGENKIVNPNLQRPPKLPKPMSSVSPNLAGQGIANPNNMQQNPSQENPYLKRGGFSKFKKQQMQRRPQQPQQQEQYYEEEQAPQQQAPSLTGMAMGFAKDQANKQINPMINKQKEQIKSKVGSTVENAIGFNPLTSIKDQAINKAASAMGIDPSVVGYINNPQQAIQNLAKQQVKNQLSNLASNNLGGNAGLYSQGIQALMSGGNVTKNLQNQGKEQLKQQMLASIDPTGGLLSGGLKAFSGGGTSEDKARAAAQATARAALGTATGGLSEVVNPETMKMAAGAADSLKNSKTLDKAGVAGDAAKGVLGLQSGALKAGAQVGDAVMGNIGDQGATTARAFKGATEGLKSITKGNMSEGLKKLGSAGLKNAVDMFIKNPANMAKSIGSTVANVGKKIASAVKKLFCFGPDTEVLMLNQTYKKIKDIQVGDEVELGGKVTLIEIVESEDMYLYEGVEVAGNHAVFENGKWVRVKNSQKGSALNKSAETYYITTENHLVVTKGVIWSDSEELEGAMLADDDKTLKELNADVVRKNILKFFQKTKFKN